ncbi:uncharacterized protein LOC127911017 [Oncorhynchus keta]|uniref:uncharacterized protein LOC127911017 n=1 Tax=Oncorhynchus keta TaxID=8018 RepID=UPI00227A0AF3|nr:uncharacterized protein LOC127911017 [Oncorhynchus keta]
MLYFISGMLRMTNQSKITECSSPSVVLVPVLGSSAATFAPPSSLLRPSCPPCPPPLDELSERGVEPGPAVEVVEEECELVDLEPSLETAVGVVDLAEEGEDLDRLGEQVESSKHTKTVGKRARQNLFPLSRLKRFGMGPQILKRFYSCTIKSMVRTGCITAWYGNCSVSDRKALQRVVRTAQYITGAKLPAIQELYTRQCQRKALKIVKDSSHNSHRLFSMLPHGKRYRSGKFGSKRLLNKSQDS